MCIEGAWLTGRSFNASMAGAISNESFRAKLHNRIQSKVSQPNSKLRAMSFGIANWAFILYVELHNLEACHLGPQIWQTFGSLGLAFNRKPRRKEKEFE